MMPCDDGPEEDEEGSERSDDQQIQGKAANRLAFIPAGGQYLTRRVHGEFGEPEQSDHVSDQEDEDEPLEEDPSHISPRKRMNRK